VAGWLTVSALALLAVGGAGSDPDGFALGLPSAAGALAVVLGVAVIAAWTRKGGRAGALLGLAAFPALLLAGVDHPAVRAWSGAALWPVVAVAVVVLVANDRLRAARCLFLPVVALVYIGHAARLQAVVGPEGDEPHYLMVSDSILRDHDLNLERDYAEGRYRAFFSWPLEPHYLVRGQRGEIFSLHAVGLSLLVLPAYAAGGYAGASFFMALLAVWLARELRELIRTVTDDDTADLGAWVVALSPPLVHYAGLVFTEVPAALGLALVLRRGLSPAGLSGRSGAFVGVALAFLPWLNVRYAPLALILLAFLVTARPRRPALVAVLLPLALSAVALLAYHWELYGFLDPRRVYGVRRPFSLSHAEDGFPGLLLDQEFGLLVYAPVYVLAVPGLVGLVRRHPRLGWAATTLIVFAFAMAGTWHMWRGGFNPPARFLVPVLPALAVAVAGRLRGGVGAAAAFLIGWSLWAGLVGAAEPDLVHRDRQGAAPLLREWSGAEEWTRLLPAYVLSEPDRHRLALPWATVLLLAALSRGRQARAVGLAAASAVLLVAAGTASALARPAPSARARSAVHLVGRPALRQPGWAPDARHAARWTLRDLARGTFFEPSRNPQGLALGERLPLGPGPYRVSLEVDLIGGRAPWVEVRTHPRHPRSPPPPTRRVVLSPAGRWYSGTLRIEPGEGAVDLVVRADSAFELRSIRLEAATSPFP